MRRKLISANWKMNGNLATNAAWLERFASPLSSSYEVLLFAPFVYLPSLAHSLSVRDRGQPIALGAQSLSERIAGAFTGEVSAEMLLDVGCNWTLVGHSERRSLYGETNDLVAAKVARAFEAGLKPMLCVGETLAERDAGQTLDVIAHQLDAVLARCSVAQLATAAIAYEPVWAIGTGRTATPAQAQEVHAAIRARLATKDAAAAAQTRLLYGGSVKASNAKELFSQLDIDGGLVGGASLDPAEFAAICAAAS